MKNKIMTHIVAGYPTPKKCQKLLLGMQDAGVQAIEIQIPFSDPGADGPTIMRANDTALSNDMTVQKCFTLIHSARTNGLNTPIYVMTYVNKLFHFGIKQFCIEANRCNVTGFIIPDLPPESSEYQEFSDTCVQYGIEIVPVLSPGMDLSRLSTYGISRHKLLYITSTQGITGKDLTIHPQLVDLVSKIRSISPAQLALGFGIRTTADVRSALEIVDIAVIGSEIIRKIEHGGITDTLAFIRQLVDDRAAQKS